MLPKSSTVSENPAAHGESIFPGNENQNKSPASSSSSPPESDHDPSVETSQDPPLPSEQPPPLPTEAPPEQTEDDGWEPIWDDRAQAFYFFNHITSVSQWENPRVPEVGKPKKSAATDLGPPGTEGEAGIKKVAGGGYDPAIHGDYDPNADYAKAYQVETDIGANSAAATTDPSAMYAATGYFNRFTGRWQNADLNPENFNDENKSKRQMSAFFDVDAAANAHHGKSLKAERSNKKLSKQELKAFKEKRREKKEEKRRAWLRD